MEYHWYEDYWAMPRNLPKGHQFFIGYYQTQRAKRFRVENMQMHPMPYSPMSFAVSVL